MADAVVVKDSPRAAEHARKLMQETNLETIRFVDFTQDINISRPPDYFLNVFNIAHKRFTINRPPCFPTIVFEACPEGRPYALVQRFPSVVNEKWLDENGVIRNNGIMGERFATDCLNPCNLGVNCWQDVTDEQLTWIDGGGTNDLTRRGLFWTKNERPGRTCMIHGGVKEETTCPFCNRPSLDELQLAKSRMEKHYRGLLQQADQFHREGQVREIGPEHHLAGDYFKVRAPWHIVAELPSTCPNCGEAIKEGIKFHTSSTGDLCVTPSVEGWKAVVNAGRRTKDQVPEDFRWWQEAKASGE